MLWKEYADACMKQVEFGIDKSYFDKTYHDTMAILETNQYQAKDFGKIRNGKVICLNYKFYEFFNSNDDNTLSLGICLMRARIREFAVRDWLKKYNLSKLDDPKFFL